MKEKNIQELAIRMGLISVDDMCQYTISQLVVKVANKVNELVSEVWRFETDVQETLKTQNENIQYLLGEGLLFEVENVFNGWFKDGTFDTLINQSALRKVNERIDETNAQMTDKIPKGGVVKTDINNLKGLLDETYFTDEFKSQIIENTQPLHVEPRDKSITQNKMAIPYTYAKIGKNLFNKNAVEQGKYVDYLTGELKDSSNHCASDFIDVSSGEVMYISGTNEQFAFYDASKNYVSGEIRVTNPITIPRGVSYLRMTCYLTELDRTQIEKGNTFTGYEDFGYKLDNEQIVDIIDESKLDDVLPRMNISKNLFNKNAVEKGKYVDYLTGKLKDSSNHGASDYIEIEGNSFYFISGTNEQFAFYDNFKNYIEGYITTSAFNGTFKSPSHAKYMRITCYLGEVDRVQIEKNNIGTDYQEYGKKIKLENLDLEEIKSYIENKKSIIVSKNGDGDFISLRDALESITDSSENNVCDVYIHEGEYNVMSYYTESEINSSTFKGLVKPPFVNLIGVGNVVLKGELEDSYPNDTKSRVATLVTYGSGKLDNLTITSKNLRYSVHDDYNYSDLEREVINCRFIKYDGYGHVQAYGGGVFSGHSVYFENCYFKSEMGIALSYHNNVDFTKPSRIKMVGCECVTTKPGQPAMRFGSMGSGQNDSVELIGCTTNELKIKEEQDNGVGIDFIFKGYGNDTFDISVSGTTDKVITNINGFIKTK